MEKSLVDSILRTMLEGDSEQNDLDMRHPNCEQCGKQIQKGERYKALGKWKQYKTCENCLRKENQEAFQRCIPPRYHSAKISDFKDVQIDPTESYFIFGAVGTGKTHLAIAIGQDQAFNAFKEPMFCNPEYLQRQIRASYSDNEEGTENALLKPIQKADVLILDDLGSLQQMASKFSIDIIYAILDYRWNYALQTIITSNKTIEEIEKLYGPAIASRIGGITGMKFLEIKGKDRRCEG